MIWIFRLESGMLPNQEILSAESIVWESKTIYNGDRFLYSRGKETI